MAVDRFWLVVLALISDIQDRDGIMSSLSTMKDLYELIQRLRQNRYLSRCAVCQNNDGCSSHWCFLIGLIAFFGKNR